MPRIGIIGGSGLQALAAMNRFELRECDTSYGTASIGLGEFAGQEIAFLTRHGAGHSIAPHAINYRANIRALADLGVNSVIAVNAVGGIRAEFLPGHLVIPDQLIDYTWGRESTYYDGKPSADLTVSEIGVQHIDFSEPYDQALRTTLVEVLQRLEIPHGCDGVYACTQGPRFETAAEVRRLQRDGCDLVGMTGMPEAALARELNMAYASLCLVVNPAPGLQDESITLDAIMAVLSEGMVQVNAVLEASVKALAMRGSASINL